MARRSTPTTPMQASPLPKDSTSPEPSPLPVACLMGPLAEVSQPQPVEITIGEVPTKEPAPVQDKPEVTVDDDGTITIS